MRVTIKWKPLPPRQPWLLASAAAVSVVTFGLAISAFTIRSGASTAKNVAVTVPDISTADLIVSEVAFISTAQGRRIAGVLKNRSSTTCKDIQMNVSLIDSDGDNAGLAEATVHQPGGHQMSKFEASAETAKAVKSY
jgi:hypothetical protein